jgi:PBP1b-binding outer membrane lipoprotein LpoB
VLFAQKLINDVLFEAQMENLSQGITRQHRHQDYTNYQATPLQQVPRGNVTASSSSAKGKAPDQINVTANQIDFEVLELIFHWLILIFRNHEFLCF